MTPDHIKAVDQLVAAMERRWGIGRLRLLVTAETRARFDRADTMWNEAIAIERDGGFPAKSVADLAAMMQRAWAAMATEAEQQGADPVGAAMEAQTASGTVLVVCATRADATAYIQANRATGRDVLVWTMEEVAALCTSSTIINAAKTHFPGCVVQSARIYSDGEQEAQGIYEASDDDPATYTAPGPSRPAYDHAKARQRRAGGRP